MAKEKLSPEEALKNEFTFLFGHLGENQLMEAMQIVRNTCSSKDCYTEAGRELLKRNFIPEQRALNGLIVLVATYLSNQEDWNRRIQEWESINTNGN